MFEELLPEDRELAEYKLKKTKEWISLALLHRVFLSNAFNYNLKNLDERNRELEAKTLAYIKEMLEKGEIKVGGLITLKKGEKRKSPEELKDEPLFYDITGTPEELIDVIRKKWDEAQEESKRENNSAILAAFESWDIVFTLKENEWPK